MNLAEAAPAFIDELIHGRGVSPETVRAYAADLEQFLTFLEEYQQRPADSHTLTDLDIRIIRAFLGKRKLAGDKASTVGRKLSTLRSWLNYIIRQQGEGTNPAALLRTPRKEDRTPGFLTRGQTTELLDQPFEEGPLGQRNCAILELLYATGIRVSELTGLDCDDIAIAEHTARVTGKGDKMRHVVFGNTAAEAVAAYLEVRGELLKPGAEQPALFLNYRGGRLTSRSVARVLRKRILQVGMALDVSPHSLRHSFATHMLNNGADIRSLQELLGHASLSTTQRYTRVGTEELMQTYLECHPRAKE